jgi:hypothetical protein
MGIISSMRKQAAVYWAPAAADDFGVAGAVTPVDIACRWEDTAEQFLDDENTVQVSRSKVYTDRDIVPGGYLLLGTVAGLADPAAHPRTIQGAFIVHQFSKLPNLKASQFLRTAML